jgi:hypothetical protein
MIFCGPLAFYARRTQGLNRIFGLAFFIERKDLCCDPGKATLMLQNYLAREDEKKSRDREFMKMWNKCLADHFN